MENKFTEQSFSQDFQQKESSGKHFGRSDAIAPNSESEATATTVVKRVKNIMSDLELM